MSTRKSLSPSARRVLQTLPKQLTMNGKPRYTKASKHIIAAMNKAGYSATQLAKYLSISKLSISQYVYRINHGKEIA